MLVEKSAGSRLTVSLPWGSEPDGPVVSLTFVPFTAGSSLLPPPPPHAAMTNANPTAVKAVVAVVIFCFQLFMARSLLWNWTLRAGASPEEMKRP